MGNNKNQQQQSDVQGITFDPTAFMDKIFNSVDRNRSDLAARPTEIVTSTLNLPVTELAESRINTFFRLIGFPATRDESIITVKPKQPDLSQVSTLNYFPKMALNLDQTEEDDLTGREQFLQATKQESDFVTMLASPLPLDESLGGSERRVNLFPLVVDAAVPVYPIERRVAPLFYDGDFILSGAADTRLPRPFLESILYMRAQTFSGPVDSIQDDLANNLKRFVTDNFPANGFNTGTSTLTAQQAVQNLGLDKTVPLYNQVSAQIISKFVQALRDSANKYFKVVQSANRLNSEVQFVPLPKDTPAEKSGNSDNFIIASRTNQLSLDSRITDLNLQLESINQLNTSLPTEKVKQADNTRRIDQGPIGLNNITADIFISEFNDLIAYDRSSVMKQLSEAKEERQRRLTLFESIKKQVMYYSGEITGLSIFDVLSVFLALFLVDLDVLVGLLNPEAQDRLKRSKFFSLQLDPANNQASKTGTIPVDFQTDTLLHDGSPLTVAQARQRLEDQVTQNFQLAAAFFQQAKKSGENKQ